MSGIREEDVLRSRLGRFQSWHQLVLQKLRLLSDMLLETFFGGSGTARMHCQLIPKFFMNFLTWVGRRRRPVNFSIRSAASATLRTGSFSNDSRIKSRYATSSLVGPLRFHCRTPSSPPSRNAFTIRSTVVRATPAILAAVSRFTSQCKIHSTSIRRRTDRFGCDSRSSLTICSSSSVSFTRNHAIFKPPCIAKRFTGRTQPTPHDIYQISPKSEI